MGFYNNPSNQFEVLVFCIIFVECSIPNYQRESLQFKRRLLKQHALQRCPKCSNQDLLLEWIAGVWSHDISGCRCWHLDTVGIYIALGFDLTTLILTVHAL